MIRNALVVVGLVAVLGLTGWEVASKERLLASGATLLLELAPVDPRSLIQGDYMRLDYALARAAMPGTDWPRTGALVVVADGDGVARFARRDNGEPLASGEHRLTYRQRRGRVQVGTDAFYFQEGTAAAYEMARYGELRVAPDGTALLVRLLDARQRPIEAP